MKLLVQRVLEASVEVNGKTVGKIGQGLLVFLGVEKGDESKQADYLANKLVNLRIFEDADGKMNLNVQQAGGSLLVVSQFTLAAETDKGLRPSFSNGGAPALAERLYDHFVARSVASGIPTQSGRFAADMQVSLLNDGPVTFLLQT